MKSFRCIADILQYIFANENIWISIKISPKFIPKGPMDDKSALVLR